jgi:guanylate kinase
MLTVATLAIMLCTISSFTALRPRMFVYKKLGLSKSPPLLSLSAFMTSTSTHNDDQHQPRVGAEAIGNETTISSLDPLIVCGPSGAGKGTIIHKFMTERGGSEKFQFTVSHTTRQPREGESDGIHYHFVSVATMRELMRQNAFLESAEVHGNYYGTSWGAMQAIHSTGRRGLLDIDVQGVKRIKEVASNAGTLHDERNHTDLQPSTSYLSSLSSASSSHALRLRPKYLFIAPPSVDALKERLIGRKSESEASLQRRIANAASELEYGLQPGNFDAVVVNDDLETAVLEFDRAVLRLYSIDGLA